MLLTLFVEVRISTHAPRTGSDIPPLPMHKQQLMISTHAPRTGSDKKLYDNPKFEFDFNPRSPHGERRD